MSLPPGVLVFQPTWIAYDMNDRSVEVCDTLMTAYAYLIAYELPAH